MADKKITELTQLTSLASGDLFVVVDDPTGTPITKKITASDIFGNGISYVTNATYPAAVVLRSVLTANVNANTASANTLVAAEFITNATSTSANSEYQYAVRAYSKLAAAAAKVTKEHAVAKFVLDVSNASSVIANTYGAIIQVANTGVRAQNVTSFLRLEDLVLPAAGVTTNQTLFLLDANGVTSNLSSTGSDDVLLSINSAATVSVNRTIKVRVNGTTLYLLAATAR